MSMWAMLGVKAKAELGDLLTSKEVWLAVLGVVVAVAKWQGWDIPPEVFVAIETLIVALIVALGGLKKVFCKLFGKAIKARGWCWCD